MNIVPPEVKEDKLEDYLATDELFVKILNQYLSLPTFKEKYRVNASDCAFELIDDAQETLLRSIEKAAARVKDPDDVFAPVRHISRTPQSQYRSVTTLKVSVWSPNCLWSLSWPFFNLLTCFSRNLHLFLSFETCLCAELRRKEVKASSASDS